MKVTKEHYDKIKSQFIECMTSITNGNIPLFIEQWELKKQGLSETRKIWDLYWMSGGSKWTKQFFESCYDTGYNDEHLHTAFKKIYNELQQIS